MAQFINVSVDCGLIGVEAKIGPSIWRLNGKVGAKHSG